MRLADRVRTNSQVTLLLDCNGICHALRHTIGGLSYNGKEIGIIFGFLLQLFSLQKRFHPYRWVFAWDSIHSFRRSIYPQYKGNRATKLNPDDERHRQSAFRQFNLLRNDVIPQLGLGEWNLYEYGYEADDLIASAVGIIPGEKIIVSQDHDLYQLLGSDCSIYNSKKRKQFFEEDFRKQFGIDPERWVEVKALAGCPGDNVEGIPHVGEITAIKYLTGQLPRTSKTYASIAASRDIIDRNHRLVDLPFEGFQVSAGSLDRMKMSGSGFQSVCALYGFDSLLSSEKLSEWEVVFGWKKVSWKMQLDQEMNSVDGFETYIEKNPLSDNYGKLMCRGASTDGCWFPASHISKQTR